MIDPSRLPSVLRCRKLFWHQTHESERFSEDPAESLESSFSQKIDELLANLRPAIGGLRLRITDPDCPASVMIPAGEGAWEILDGTAAMHLRTSHLLGLAHRLKRAFPGGIRIERAFVATLRKNYLRYGAVDPAALFDYHDVSRKLPAIMPELEAAETIASEVSSLSVSPIVATGPQCEHGGRCPLWQDCHPPLPEGSVFELSRGARLARELMAEGIRTLAEIPDTTPLLEAQRIQIRAARTGNVQIHAEKLAAFFQTARAPFHFLDFEACQFALPPLEGMKPYVQIPFQFSLHIRSGTDITHAGFLAEHFNADPDPREQFLEALRLSIRESGTIFAFNSGFEISRLRELIHHFPAYRAWFRDLEKRFLDLWEPFRYFHVYHPKQAGKTGMKTLLPIFCGKNYEDLAIRDGLGASRSFLALATGNIRNEEVGKCRADLEAYCRRDTEALMGIHDALRGILAGCVKEPGQTVR